MYRNIFAILKKWKDNPYRKPLILQGARQVGKTYSILEFGRTHFANTAYLNFETVPSLRDLFAGDISPDKLLPAIAYASGQTIIAGKTLIVFDEVQLCERALTSLKYFCENAPEYHIIVAGSLLGVAVNRTTFSFPVGKVDIRTMYPMDMEEFLLACGQDYLVEQIRECYSTNLPIPATLHEEGIRLYRQYLLVGGMPECVRRFVETGDFNLVRETQCTILSSYLNDMSKYNTANEIKKTRLTYESITAQLSKENTRFQYKLVKKGGRAAEFENAIDWLCLSGIVSRVHKADKILKPLDNYKDIDAFKIYMSDTGLLCAKNDLKEADVMFMGDDMNAFKGGLTENYVCSQLIIAGHKPYYWASGNDAEVDFVVQMNDGIIPIEVKSARNTKAKSLKIYTERYTPAYAIKLSTKNLGFDSGIKSVPLYAMFLVE